jgi:hypothetical protein
MEMGSKVRIFLLNIHGHFVNYLLDNSGGVPEATR